MLQDGVSCSQIIELALDVVGNAKYRNPFELDKYIRERITDNTKNYYVFIDEIQFVYEMQNPYVNNSIAKITFIDVVLGLIQMPNVDVYITGSNSYMLSSDILTQFRDRSDEIKVYPVSFAEFYDAYNDDKRGAWQDYCTYGGMPYALFLETHEEKSKYLSDLCERTYIRDVLDRHDIRNESGVLDILLNIVASGIGSLTNPTRIANTFETKEHHHIKSETITQYIDYFVDAFLLDKATKYSIKGRKYIQSPFKYYFSDVGLRNAILGFRQLEETHLMENVLYNDLKRRGFNVDVGEVEYNTKNSEGNKIRKQLEVDFVVNRGSQRFYIQSALTVADPEKRKQEIASLLRIPDSFKKIVVVKEYMKPRVDENGIEYIGVEQFLLDDGFLD